MDLSLPLQIFVITEWPGSTCKDPLEETHKALEEKEAEELACGVCSGKVADAIIKPCNHISCCVLR